MADLVRDANGATVHDSRWPRCHSCGKQTAGVRPLTYVRRDGVRGMSYPDCAECRRGNKLRLERMGFTMTGRARSEETDEAR